MNFRKKSKEKREIKRSIKSVLVLCSMFFLLFSTHTFAQDSIAFPKDLNEEKELKFQHYFFIALSQKSIRNFQKAIDNLESCNQILPNDVAVFFEFSKNYYALNQIELSKEYIDRALEKDPQNSWMLEHLVAVLQRSNNYAKAIEIQLDLINQKPKNTNLKEGLVRLYLRNNQPEKALMTLNGIKNQNGSTASLQNLKKALENRKSRFTKGRGTDETCFFSSESLILIEPTYL